VDRALAVFEAEQYLLAAEGGYSWMQRDLRDTLYSLNSQYTSTSDPKGPLHRHRGDLRQAGEDVVRDLPRVLGQALLLALHQSRTARYYYSENYVQSNDARAFFEYVYHRVSSIRYLAQLLFVFDRAERGSPVAQGFTDYLAGLVEEVFPPGGERPGRRSH